MIRVAWVAYDTEFEDVVWDDAIDPLAIAVDEGENDHPTARARFALEDGIDPSTKEAAWFAWDGSAGLVPLFYGQVSKTGIGYKGKDVEIDFVTKPDDIDARVAQLLANAVYNDRSLYIPEFGEAQDATDAGTILAASSLQIEYDRLRGYPALCSIFGDPDRYVVIEEDDILEDSFEMSINGIPASGGVLSLVLEWDEHKVEESNAGGYVQTEIDRIGQFFGVQGSTLANFTFTPDVLNSWPKQGETIGNSWQVRYSALVATAGPGTVPKSESDYAPIYVPQPSKDAAGVMVDAEDFDEDGFDGSGESLVALEATSFSYPLLQLYGVRTRPRREVVQIYIPFEGQEVVKGNGETIYVSLSATGLDKDETTAKHEVGGEYEAFDEVQEYGVLWRSLEQHRSKGSVISESLDISDPASSTYGQQLWEPRPGDWKGVLGSSDCISAILTPWGRRALANGIRRVASNLAFRSRTVETRARIDLEQALAIDTRSTVRFNVPNEVQKGGYIEGKCVGISFVFNGETGDHYADIVVVSAVGGGNWEDNGIPPGSVEPVPADSIENVDYAVADPDGIYDGPFPVDPPSWWPAERSWPPNANEDTFGYYTHSYGVRVEDGNSYLYQVSDAVGLLPPLSSNPYDAVFPAQEPTWWPVVNGDQFNPNNGKKAFPWPPGTPVDNSVYPPVPDVMASSDPFQYYKVAPENDYLDGSGGIRGEVFEGGMPDSDPAEEQDDFDPGDNVPVAGPGGSWDQVRYTQPIVGPDPLPEDFISVRVNWLGVEQGFALANPGDPIPDPYGRLPGAVKNFQFNGPLDLASEFLQRFPTEIIVGIDEPTEDDIAAKRVAVICTRGWRGPKQVEL